MKINSGGTVAGGCLAVLVVIVLNLLWVGFLIYAVVAGAGYVLNADDCQQRGGSWSITHVSCEE